MKRNICPKCGNPVMPYWRFFRAGSLFILKTSECRSCGVGLRRAPGALILVAWCMVGLIVARVIRDFPPFSHGIQDLFEMLGWPLVCIIVGHYLWWRYEGWEAVEKEKE